MKTSKESDEARKMRLLKNAEEAKRMDATVIPNNITMEEIIAEIKKIRHGEKKLMVILVLLFAFKICVNC